MFKQLTASAKPPAPRYYAIITDEGLTTNAGLGRHLITHTSERQALAQQRQWKREYPAVRTRVLEVNKPNIPIRKFVDAKLDLAPSHIDRYGGGI
jgi:hypothetical protein